MGTLEEWMRQDGLRKYGIGHLQQDVQGDGKEEHGKEQSKKQWIVNNLRMTVFRTEYNGCKPPAKKCVTLVVSTAKTVPALFGLSEQWQEIYAMLRYWRRDSICEFQNRHC